MDILTAIVEPFQYEFMIRALIASLLVGIVSSVVSCYLVVKRWALLGDAIAHAVLPGVAIAFLLQISFFIGALITGLLTALGIGVITKHSRIKEDTAIGVMFTTVFACGVLILSIIRAKSIDLYHILFGNVLGVSTSDLILTAVTGILVLAIITFFFKELLLHAFDPVMASSVGLPSNTLHYLLMFVLTLTIVASLQTVGIVLVIAMLITPGATAFLLSKRLSTMMLIGAGLGVISALVGLYASYYYNVASGAMMVMVAGMLFFTAFLFSPSEGLVWKALNKRKIAKITHLEDCLTAIYRIQDKQGYASYHQIEEKVGQASVKASIAQLAKEKLLVQEIQGVRLLPKGKKQALFMIRAHRLWESYLTEKADIPVEYVHEFAHKYEHLTTEQMLDELAKSLKYPKKDPHGSEIPK